MNILIIDTRSTAPEYAEKIKKRSPENKVFYTNDGEEALDILHNQPFDIIITELMVKKISGMDLLKHLYENHLQEKAKKYVISFAFNDNLISEAFSYGIDFFMIKPVSYDMIVRRVFNTKVEPKYIVAQMTTKKVLDEVSEKMDNYELSHHIDDLFKDLGLSVANKGYKYAKDGIMKFYNSEDNTDVFMTKELYPLLARKYDTTSSRVERAIRYSVGKTWEKGNLELIQKIFGSSVDPYKGRPTNREFLITICEYLKSNA